MQNAISIFNFNQSQVRIQFHNGEPYFCLTDVAEILNIQNTKQSRFNLKEAGVHKMYVSHESGKKLATFINEPNLYRVIFRSNKPEAVKFQDWIFEEVIPQIRATGSYTVKVSTQQKQQIQAAVNRRVHRTGETHQAIYTAIHELAQVASYHDIAATDFERIMAFLENALSEKQPEQPKIPDYDYGMARLFVKHGAGVAQVSDLHMALYQLSHIQNTFLKMLEHKALHFKLNDAEQRCLEILANWQMAIANVGCKL